MYSLSAELNSIQVLTLASNLKLCQTLKINALFDKALLNYPNKRRGKYLEGIRRNKERTCLRPKVR